MMLAMLKKDCKMEKTTTIGRMVKSSLVAYRQKDMISALINIMPAIDSTANKEYGGGVGFRIKSFFRKDEGLINFIAIGMLCLLPSFLYPGKTKAVDFADILYDNIRTYIVHTGEVSEIISFNNNNTFSFGTKWDLNEKHVLAFILCVIISEKNANEFIDGDEIINLNFGNFSVNDLWGRHDDLLHHIANNSKGKYKVKNSKLE
ncbi:TPA: hypothetical protein ACMEYA_004232 [Klebsiella pneumoniae]|uniref:hypothetical protein n=2 Tax=Klebsiella/Raoultella group TaxID=2890311 RepID=UPI001B8AF91C|nr:hypothetical protein [Klebsiella pneumoniae]MBQ5141637.1 hypothetical protein [Klebsiella pneumoniae]MBS2915599.1 hypothetical protein [Klebsiella pneumoniae]